MSRIYFYKCPICGHPEAASTKPALRQRMLQHLVGHLFEFAQADGWMEKIDEAIRKVEADEWFFQDP